jgi:hypothetical protein
MEIVCEAMVGSHYVQIIVIRLVTMLSATETEGYTVVLSILLFSRRRIPYSL